MVRAAQRKKPFRRITRAILHFLRYTAETSHSPNLLYEIVPRHDENRFFVIKKSFIYINKNLLKARRLK